MRRVGSDLEATYSAYARGQGDTFVAPPRGEKKAAKVDLYEGPAAPAKAAAEPAPAPVPAQPETPQAVSTPAGCVFPSDRPILLFNSDCAVCRKIAGWVRKSDDPEHGGRGKIDERPIGY